MTPPPSPEPASRSQARRMAAQRGEQQPVTDAELFAWRDDDQIWNDLLARADLFNRLIRDRARDQGRIRKYGNHSGSCSWRQSPHVHDGEECDDASIHPCDCGWAELQRALRGEVPDGEAQ